VYANGLHGVSRFSKFLFNFKALTGKINGINSSIFATVDDKCLLYELKWTLEEGNKGEKRFYNKMGKCL
jgi:hypothetical protein